MKYFIDCGHNLGQGLRKLTEGRGILNNPEWKIYAFDISGRCIEESKKNNLTNIEYIQKAVWTGAGKIEARLQTSVNEEVWGGIKYPPGLQIGGGSTVLSSSDLNPQQFQHICGPPTAWQKKEEVETIDFCKFFEDLPDKEYVILKMDIEGAEYFVLPKFIEKDLFKQVNEFICEFHSLITNFAFNDVEANIMNEIHKSGTRFTRWY